MHFDCQGNLGQVYALARFATRSVQAFRFKCATWSLYSLFTHNLISIIEYSWPSIYHLDALLWWLNWLIGWFVCCYWWLYIVYIPAAFLHLKFVGNGIPCSTRSFLRYVLHIITICHDFWELRTSEEIVSRGSGSKVNTIKDVATVASTSSSSINIFLRSWYCAEKGERWVSSSLNICTITGSQRTKELLPASLIAELLILFSICTPFQIICQSLIWTLRNWALGRLVEVMKVVCPRWLITALLVYKSYVISSIDKLIHTLPLSLVHWMHQPGLRLILLFKRRFFSTIRKHTVIAWIFSIYLL